MTSLSPRLSVVLAVKPTHRGFGWVAFEGPFAPYDADSDVIAPVIPI